MTPQMMILGRSGSDLNDDYVMDVLSAGAAGASGLSSTLLVRTTSSSQPTSTGGGWFSRWTTAALSPTEQGEQHELEEYHELSDPPVSALPLQHEHDVDDETPLYYDAEKGATTQIAVDALKQDCNYFFRSNDDAASRAAVDHYYGLKTIRRNTNQNSDLFHYSNAVDCVSPVVLQHYRTKYTQLNHPDYDAAARNRRDRHGSDDAASSICLDDAPDNHNNSNDDDPWYDDLRLTDNDHDERDSNHNNNNHYRDASSSSRYHRHIVHADSVAASSLLFEQDGRRLMRLPRDQVRLWADPDFEPGVLSVEQCRRRNDNDDEETEAWHQHPLRYVLTVDDGIFRQVVTEMSPQQTRCCHVWGCLRRDQERVDICVAYILFGLILLILAVNTLLERMQ